MIYKEVKGNELYIYMNGKLIYKRWLKENKGIVFCDVWGHWAFRAVDVKKQNG